MLNGGLLLLKMFITVHIQNNVTPFHASCRLVHLSPVFTISGLVTLVKLRSTGKSNYEGAFLQSYGRFNPSNLWSSKTSDCASRTNLPSPKSYAELVDILQRALRSCRMSSIADMSFTAAGVGTVELLSFATSCFASCLTSSLSRLGETGGDESSVLQNSC